MRRWGVKVVDIIWRRISGTMEQVIDTSRALVEDAEIVGKVILQATARRKCSECERQRRTTHVCCCMKCLGRSSVYAAHESCHGFSSVDLQSSDRTVAGHLHDIKRHGKNERYVSGDVAPFIQTGFQSIESSGSGTAEDDCRAGPRSQQQTSGTGATALRVSTLSHKQAAAPAHLAGSS